MTRSFLVLRIILALVLNYNKIYVWKYNEPDTDQTIMDDVVC